MQLECIDRLSRSRIIDTTNRICVETQPLEFSLKHFYFTIRSTQRYIFQKLICSCITDGEIMARLLLFWSIPPLMPRLPRPYLFA